MTTQRQGLPVRLRLVLDANPDADVAVLVQAFGAGRDTVLSLSIRDMERAKRLVNL